jgi:hypothetical protein
MYRLFNDGARYLASASELRWVWPTGEELLFRFGKEESDYWDYHGQEFPFIGFNELTKQQSAEFYEMMFSCRRSSFRPENYPLDNGSLLKPIPLETFSTTNPFGIGHTWVKKRFIEPAPRGTVIRETQKVFNPQTEREEDVTLTRVAIHGSFKENPYLDPQYIATLMAIKDPNRRKAWVEGSWDVTSGGRFDHLWNASHHVIKPFRIPRFWLIHAVVITARFGGFFYSRRKYDLHNRHDCNQRQYANRNGYKLYCCGLAYPQRMHSHRADQPRPGIPDYSYQRGNQPHCDTCGKPCNPCGNEVFDFAERQPECGWPGAGYC